MGQRLESIPVLDERGCHVQVGGVDEPAYLLVEDALGGLGDFAGAAEEGSATVGGEDPDESDGVAHPPPADHLARDRGDLVDVGFGSGADRAKHRLLRHPAAECHLDLGEQILAGVGDLVVIGRRQSDAEGGAARE